MSLSSLRIAAALLLTTAADGVAQQRPTLPERLDTLTVRFAETVIGRGVMHWTRQNGTHLQVYVWTSAFDGSSVTDSLFSDARTLRPQREVRVAGDTTHVIEFTDQGVTARTIAGGAIVSVTRVVEAGLYSSASIEALAASMPLESGASAEFRTYYAPPSRHGALTTRFKVVSREAMSGRPAWRVTASTPGGGSAFWVDEATRTVLLMETREGEAVITFRR
jgi:hypothetical protein